MNALSGNERLTQVSPDTTLDSMMAVSRPYSTLSKKDHMEMVLTAKADARSGVYFEHQIMSERVLQNGHAVCLSCFPSLG